MADQPTPEERLSKFGFTLPTTSEDSVKLLIGVSVDGKVLKTAKVRPMTGKDRKAAASGRSKKSASHMASVLLQRCITDIGGQPPTLPIVKEMTEADRTHLVLEIRRQTFPGEPMQFIAQCQNEGCGSKIDVSVDLDDLDLFSPEGITWQNHSACFTATDEKLGMRVTMRYLQGRDMEELSAKYSSMRRKDINPVEMVDESMLRMLVSINDEPVEAEDYEAFPSSVIDAIEAMLSVNRAGPDLEQYTRCPDCGLEVQLELNIMDFFLRGSRKKGSKR